MRTRVALVLWTALLGAVACGPDEGDERPKVFVQELSRAFLASTTDTGGVLLESPVAMALWNDSLVIADMLGSQIVILPRSLQGGRAFGREGAGPGELRSPQSVSPIGETLAVFDRGNARVTWFNATGGARESRSLMIVSLNPKFVALEDGGLLLPAASKNSYGMIQSAWGGDAAASASEEGSTAWLKRPPGASPLDEMPITSNMVINRSGHVFFVDAENGIIVHGESGSDTQIDSLPASFRASANHVMDSLAAGDSRGERRLTPVIAAGEAPDGILVWLVGPGEKVGGILSASGEWTEVVLEPRVRSEFPTDLYDVLVWDNELVVLAQDGVRAYRLADSP